MKKIFASYLFIIAIASCTDQYDLSKSSKNSKPNFTQKQSIKNNRNNESIFDVYVSLGDSLTHGSHCLTVDETRQPYTWPALIARQMGTEFNQPILKFPGYMVNLEDIGKGKIKWYEYFYPLSGGVRKDHYRNQDILNNFGITSATADQIITSAIKTKNVFFNNLLGTVLPYHHLVLGFSGKSAVDQALDRDPTFVSLWIGNNDTLISAVIMMKLAITPKKVFEENWNKIVNKILNKDSVQGVVVGNIPHLMDIALFEPQSDGSYKSVWQPDYNDIGEILSKEEVEEITDHINYFNQIIKETAITYDWAFVDANSEFHKVKHNGFYELKHAETYINSDGDKVQVGSGRIIGTEYLEGLFSLDGIHPSITGYSIVANYVIDAINKKYGTELEFIDEYEISEKDTLLKDPFDPRPWTNSWVFQKAYNIYKIIF